MLWPLKSQPVMLKRINSAVCLLCIGLILLPIWSFSDDGRRTVDFAIPAQSLSSALTEFGAQANYHINFNPALLEGYDAPAIQGSMSIQQAISSLLSDKGLEWQINANNIDIKAIDFGDAELLSTVIVEQSDIGSSGTDAAILTDKSTSHITETEISRFRGASVGDIFKGQSGVLVGENRNSGGLDVNIRGMQGQSRVPVLLDGSRQETTVYRGYSGVSSRTYIDPDLISSIDIDKGPTMSAEAVGAIGGMVSMNTISANDLIQGDKDFAIRLKTELMGNTSSSVAPNGLVAGLPSGSSTTDGTFYTNCNPFATSVCKGVRDINLAYGPDNTLNRPSSTDLNSYSGSIALAKRFTNFDLVAAYANRKQGHYYAGKYGPAGYVDLKSNVKSNQFYDEVTPVIKGASRFRGQEMVVNSNTQSQSALLKASIFLSDSHSLELSYQRYANEYSQLMPSQLIWFNKIKQTPPSTVYSNTYIGKYRYQPSDNDYVNLKLNLWATDLDSINNNYSQDVDFANAERELYHRYGGDISNKSNFLDSRLSFNYGLSFQLEKVGNRFVNSNFIGDSQYRSGRDGRRREYSMFIASQYQLAKQLRLNTGARYIKFSAIDNKEYTLKGGSLVDCRGEDTCDKKHFEYNFSDYAPIVSLTYEPWKNVQFYTRYAQGVRMPSLFESTSGFSTRPLYGEGLKPEHAYNKEIGFNLVKPNIFLNEDKLSFKLALFDNKTKDYLTRTSPNLWDKNAGGQFFVTRNIRSISLQGYELFTRYDAGYAYVQFGHTAYNKIKVCHYGSFRRDICNNYGVANSYFNNMIPPNKNTNLTLGGRLFQRKLEIGVRALFMGTRNQPPEYNDNTQLGFLSVIPWEKYKIYDVYASYKPKQNLTINFNIDNLTDRYYLDALGLGLVPSPGRTLRVGFEWMY